MLSFRGIEYSKNSVKGGEDDMAVTTAKLANFIDDILKLLKEITVYELMPISNKIVFFDNRLMVREAFLGLMEQDLKCAMVIDEENEDLRNIITVTDFIKMLLHYKTNEVNGAVNAKHSIELEQLTISKWIKISSKQKMVSVTEDKTLLNALRVLKDNNIRRLPIIDSETKRVISVQNYSRFLRFVFKRYLEEENSRELMSQIRVRDLCQSGIGDFNSEDLAKIDEVPVLDVLEIIDKERSACIPLVDKNGFYVDSFTSSDVRYLVLDGNYMRLDLSVKKVIGKHHEKQFGKVEECALDNTLLEFLEKMISNRKHAAVCLNKKRKVLGVITLSDIFDLFLANE